MSVYYDWKLVARKLLREDAWLRGIRDADERAYWWCASLAMRVYFR